MRLRTVASLIVLSLMMGMLGSCAYFNAFYLAKKNFKDGEHYYHRNDDKINSEAKKRYDSSAKWAREVIREYPKSRYIDDSYYIIGLAQYRQENFSVAIAQFEEIVDNYPESDYLDDAQYHRALSYIGLEQYENARLVLRELVNIKDNDYQGKAGLALSEIALLSEQWEDLLVGAQAVLDIDPDDNEKYKALFYKGEALYNLERYDDCLEVLLPLEKESLPSELKFKVNTRIAQSHAQQGNYDKGLGYLTQLEGRGEFERFAPHIKLGIGYIHELRKDYDQAIDTYKKMAADYPDSIPSKDAWYRVGNIILQDLSRASEAKEAFSNVGTRPNSIRADYFDHAAMKIAQIDSMNARIDRIDKLADDTERRSKSRFALAELYTFSFNRPDSASTQYNHIIEENPDSEYAVMSNFHLNRFSAMTGAENDLSEEQERQVAFDIIEKYPESEFAGKLRSYLGVDETNPHIIALRKAEKAKNDGRSWQEYIPMYQAVADSFPGTGSSYKSRYVIAYSYEHDAEDTETALDYYRELADEDPDYFSEKYVLMARDKIKYYEEEPELLAEIEQYLADWEMNKEKQFTGSVGGDMSTVASISPEAGLSGLRRIRARNARIRSRYYTN